MIEYSEKAYSWDSYSCGAIAVMVLMLGGLLMQVLPSLWVPPCE